MKFSAEDMTPVFPHHIKPTRTGVYRLPNQPVCYAGWAHFCAKTDLWGWAVETPQEANSKKNQSRPGAAQNKRWQGLRQEYKA